MDRSQIGTNRSTWSQLRMLADRAGLPGAGALIQHLDPILTDYIHRELKSHPCEPRSTAESIARGVWRRAFLRDNFDFWNADNETDALDAFYCSLTFIADEVARDYQSDNFAEFQKRHERLVDRIFNRVGVPQDFHLRDDAKQNLWLRIAREIPLHDIMDESQEKFVWVKATDVACDCIRQLERHHERTVDQFPDLEDPYSNSSWSYGEELEKIAATYKNPDLAMTFFELRLSGMSWDEVAQALEEKPRYVKAVWEDIKDAAWQRYPQGMMSEK
jgi:hypothetical protein